MVLYGEYLFLENALTGAVILFFTSRILQKQIGIWRYVICSMLCGAYAFVLFTSLHGWLSFFLKILFSMVIAWLGLGNTPFGNLVRRAATFLVVTVVYGGIAMALISSFGWTGITAVSGVYMAPLTYGTVTVAAVLGAGGLWWIIDAIKAKRMDQRTTATVELIIGEKSFSLKGLIDSGNRLQAPLSGKPVCLVRQSLMESLLEEVNQKEERYTVVPYYTVGVKRGILEGYRMDTLHIDGNILQSPVVAACEELELLGDDKEFQILLPAMVLERGMYGDSEYHKKLD